MKDMLSTGIITETSQVAVLPFAVVAVIVASPAAFAVTLPSLSTLAISGAEELQVTVVSVAVVGSNVTDNVSVPFISNVSEVFLSEILTTGTDTVTSQVAVLPFAVVAVIVAVPAAFAVTLPVLSTVATAGADELQETDLSAAVAGS